MGAECASVVALMCDGVGLTVVGLGLGSSARCVKDFGICGKGVLVGRASKVRGSHEPCGHLYRICCRRPRGQAVLRCVALRMIREGS